LLDALLEKKLILGGPILKGPAKFWWKGEIVAMEYAYIVTYTLEALKERLIAAAEEVSEEEVPMISFLLMEGNKRLLQFLGETLEK